MKRALIWAVAALITLGSLLALAVIRLPGSAAASSLSFPPHPLRGITLRGETGLRLLLADQRPSVLDVDTAGVTPLPEVPAMTQALFNEVRSPALRRR